MNVLTHFQKVTTFVFDIDGVLTDGTVLLLENGLQARQMHVKDGLALQMALKWGYRVVILSGGYSEPVVGRFEKLGVHEVHLRIHDKKDFLENYLEQNRLHWEEVLFMGDDLPDVALLQLVGASACPADAVSEAKAAAKYISPVRGGYGCVRDVIEKVLKLNNHWIFDTSVTSR
ncbi:KdsC family phosphatase [Pseudocnuella soli]|uniref:KdsC family phosphatase n=1 Tax=Pseudocnuella soli TaxID=2502779 RepID=UPI00104C3737|nr:HAD hydrolase family protein [Pseudocnuella soli]